MRGALTSNMFPPFARYVPVLELIFSCVESSYELFSTSGTEYINCTPYGGAAQDTGNGCEGDVAAIFEEKPHAKKCCKGKGC